MKGIVVGSIYLVLDWSLPVSIYDFDKQSPSKDECGDGIYCLCCFFRIDFFGDGDD